MVNKDELYYALHAIESIQKLLSLIWERQKKITVGFLYIGPYTVSGKNVFCNIFYRTRAILMKFVCSFLANLEATVKEGYILEFLCMCNNSMVERVWWAFKFHKVV